MTRDERRHVEAIHDASAKLLVAKGAAEAYFARAALADAMLALANWAKERRAELGDVSEARARR